MAIPSIWTNLHSSWMDATDAGVTGAFITGDSGSVVTGTGTVTAVTGAVLCCKVMASGGIQRRQTFSSGWVIFRPVDQSYCWWLKSCTTWDGWNPIKKGINTYHLSTGFQPSTVSIYLTCGKTSVLQGCIGIVTTGWLTSLVPTTHQGSQGSNTAMSWNQG